MTKGLLMSSLLCIMAICAVFFALSMLSCTERCEEMVNYEVGSIVDYDDLVALNKKFMNKTLNKKFSYGIETFICKEYSENFVTKDEIDMALHSQSYGYNYAVLFDAFYPDSPSLRYFFAHKPSAGVHKFVYIGVKEIPSDD